jgi:IS605 OrfB family transposase
MAKVIRTIRLKVKPESYVWLNGAAIEVNQVWNWAAATCADAADRGRRASAKFLSGYELCALSAGSSKLFEYIGADTIARICIEYSNKRRQSGKIRLKWRASGGSRKSLGWIPFKASGVIRCDSGLRYSSKAFRFFNDKLLNDVEWGFGCFAQDACGDWWLSLTTEPDTQMIEASESDVGIDLGLKDIASTSDGEHLKAGCWTHAFSAKLAGAQRRGHKRQAKRIHRKIARCRADALHKFSRSIVDRYQTIVIGDVSSASLGKTQMAKSVYDSGWSMLKAQLQYKGQQAGRNVQIVSERNTTRTCSNCGALTGPSGLDMLAVRQWECSECGTEHDRDVNAAKNILNAGSSCRTSVRGNERCQVMAVA